MPRKQTTCARKPGHAPPSMAVANMASRRAYRRAHPHPESPESRKKSNRKYRIASYGLRQEDFDLLLKLQDYVCAMCREPFEEGQLIHVDHDYECCRVKNQSCGKCVRGLLCDECNIALATPSDRARGCRTQPWPLNASAAPRSSTVRRSTRRYVIPAQHVHREKASGVAG